MIGQEPRLIDWLIEWMNICDWPKFITSMINYYIFLLQPGQCLRPKLHTCTSSQAFLEYLFGLNYICYHKIRNTSYRSVTASFWWEQHEQQQSLFPYSSFTKGHWPYINRGKTSYTRVDHTLSPTQEPKPLPPPPPHTHTHSHTQPYTALHGPT